LGSESVDCPLTFAFPSSHLDAVRAVAFHPRDMILATGGDDLSVKIWRMDAAQLSSTRFVQDFVCGLHTEFAPPVLVEQSNLNHRSHCEGTPHQSLVSSSPLIAAWSTLRHLTRRSVYGQYHRRNIPHIPHTNSLLLVASLLVIPTLSGA
jgi:WD40 repeat protein